MHVYGLGVPGAHGHNGLDHDRSPAKDVIRTALRVASYVSAAISGGIFLVTGSLKAAFWFGISLISAFLLMRRERSERPARVHLVADPLLVARQQAAQLRATHQAVEVLDLLGAYQRPNSPRSQALAYGAPPLAPQPAVSRSGRDQVGAHNQEVYRASLPSAPSYPSSAPAVGYGAPAVAPQPAAARASRDEVGAHNREVHGTSGFPPSLMAPRQPPAPRTTRDQVGARSNAPSAPPVAQSAPAPQPSRNSGSGRDQVGGRNQQASNTPAPSAPPSNSGRDQVGSRKK